MPRPRKATSPRILAYVIAQSVLVGIGLRLVIPRDEYLAGGLCFALAALVLVAGLRRFGRD